MKNTDAQQPGIHSVLSALRFALGLAICFALVQFLFDEVAKAYLWQGVFDVSLSYLQNLLNQALVWLVVLLIGGELILWLGQRILNVSGKVLTLLRIAWVTGSLFVVMGLYFNLQPWFPPLLSTTAVLYDGLILLSGLTLAWLFVRRVRKSVATAQHMKRIAFLAGVIVVTNGFVAYKKSQFTNEDPNVIVILIDALRSDHLGCYGYSRDTSPNLDRFAEEGVVFTNSISQSSHTKASITSLFTSLYPIQHDVIHGNRRDDQGNFYSDVLGESFKTMAEYLQGGGYNTAGFLVQGQLRGYMGFSQGFNYYDSYLGNARNINRQFFRWLPVNKYRKFFAYLHYLDVHAPYAPSKKNLKILELSALVGDAPGKNADMVRLKQDWAQFQNALDAGEIELSDADVAELVALYDAGIRDMDDRLGALFAKLKAEGVYDNSLIIFTADHGDGFMEHGLLDHGTSLYEEVLRVPLIVRFPNGARRGVSEEPVQTIDVLPTILDVVGIPPGNTLMGRSVLDFLGGFSGERPRVSERGDLIALLKGKYKYIFNKRRKTGELYNIEEDPGEQVNLAKMNPELTRGMKQAILDFMGHFATKTPAKREAVELDKETIEKLKTLGYIR